MIRRWTFLTLGLLALAACGGSGESSLEAFRRAWLDAVNRRQFEALYDMLDAQSRRRVALQLEQLRGLTPGEQKAVIDQLGGKRVEHLGQLTPEAYFALLWARATEGLRPTLTVEATGADAAYMELALEEGKTQRIRLSVEAGRWVWHLPDQGL